MSHKREIYNPQKGNILSHNREMGKNINLGEILAANVKKLMSSNADLDGLEKVAAKAVVGGKKIGRNTVHRIQNNSGSATLRTVEGLARAFDVSPLDLLTDDETKQEISRSNKMMELFQQLPEPNQKALLAHAQGLVWAKEKQEEQVTVPEVPAKTTEQNNLKINPR